MISPGFGLKIIAIANELKMNIIVMVYIKLCHSWCFRMMAAKLIPTMLPQLPDVPQPPVMTPRLDFENQAPIMAIKQGNMIDYVTPMIMKKK
jgi:hypothetical protein